MTGTLRSLFSAIVLICFACVAFATPGVDSPRQFNDLKEATAVLDHCLASEGRPELLKIVASTNGHFAQEPALFDILKREWRRTGSFSALYSGRKFPVVGGTFKLGGHDKELGHLHIDFKRTAGGWVLDDIWLCR